MTVVLDANMDEWVTYAEIARRLPWLKLGTVRQWINRNRIHPADVARDARGRVAGLRFEAVIDLCST